MGFYRLYPVKDTWISNKINDYLDNPLIRITGSNFGRSPTLRIFKISGSDYPNSLVQIGRALLKFDITELSGKIYDDKIIPSSSVNYTLKLFDYKHDGETPSSYNISIFPLTRSWNEGNGISDDDYKDSGYCNWLSASSTEGWSNDGADFLTAGFGSSSMAFDYGYEDFAGDVTEIVGNWLTASVGKTTGLNNDGLVVVLSKSQEENLNEYKTKIFHGRETMYVEKLPYIEAQYDDSIKDNRNNFAYNQNSNLFFYNNIRGQLTAVTQPLTVRLQDNIMSQSCSYRQEFTSAIYKDGVYSCSFNVSNSASHSSSWYDIWFSGSTVYMTGTFTPLVLTGNYIDQHIDYVASTNLRRNYRSNEDARIKVQFKKRNNITHILHTASLDCDAQYIENAYYKIINNENNEEIVPFATGSVKYTKMSYDKDGNYFNLFMSSLVQGFTYKLQFLIDENNDKIVIDDNKFIFKVI